MSMEVANTIRDQVGHRALMMIGAKNLTGDKNSLSFKIGRNSAHVTHIRVTLEPSDTYTVQFYRVRRHNRTLVSEERDIYGDGLRDCIERNTGLYTSLGTMGRSGS